MKTSSRSKKLLSLVSTVSLLSASAFVGLLDGCADAGDTTAIDATNEDETNLGSVQSAITDPLSEFPYRVLPIRIVLPATSVNPKKCLSVNNGETAVNADIVTQDCINEAKQQDWFLTKLVDNSYQIRPGHTGGRLLGIDYWSSDPQFGATMQVTTDSSARWEIIAVPGTQLHQLKNVKTQKCMAQGGNLQTCLNNSATHFSLAPKYAFPYSLMAKHSGKCLNVADGTPTALQNNANVQQYTCVGAANERWYLDPVPSAPTQFYIKSMNSNKCLDIAGGSMADNGNAQQYDCIGVENERWTVSSAGEGYFYIKNVHSNKCLTVAGGGTTSNTNVDQYTCVNADNQKWRWNYFTKKHVQLVIARNSAGQYNGGSSTTEIQTADWDRSWQVARDVFKPYGIELEYDPSADRAVVNSDALNSYGVNNTVANCYWGVQTSPGSCAEHFSSQYPGKVVVIATGSTAGASSGDASSAQVSGLRYLDQCGEVGDNKSHVAHELGHFFGNLHTHFDGNDDWLSDTPVDAFAGDVCRFRNGSYQPYPDLGNNVMSYYVPVSPKLTPTQGDIARAAAYARYATPTQ